MLSDKISPSWTTTNKIHSNISLIYGFCANHLKDLVISRRKDCCSLSIDVLNLFKRFCMRWTRLVLLVCHWNWGHRPLSMWLAKRTSQLSSTFDSFWRVCFRLSFSSSRFSSVRVFRLTLVVAFCSVIEGDVRGQLLLHNNKHHMTLSLARLQEEKGKEREKREKLLDFLSFALFRVRSYLLLCTGKRHSTILRRHFSFLRERLPVVSERQTPSADERERKKEREREREKEKSTKAI